jgi:cation diffusion facilitator family transporter
MISPDERADKAGRVTWVGFFLNLLLVAFKLSAGILGHSAAMIADAVHSLSDFATDIVVLVSFRVIRKPVDKGHDYGHGKFETLATAIIGIVLLFVGAGILWSGAHRIYDSLTGTVLRRPGTIALVAAVLSIVSKEWLYRYTAKVGREIDSQAVIANAWHHRSDAFSSIGTTLGIGGAILFGDRWHVLDPVAAVVVSFFIIKVAVSISAGSIRDLTEGSLDDELEEEILAMVGNVEGVAESHGLRTRRVGNTVAIELHILVDKNLTVLEGHNIASKVETAVRDRFGQEAFVSVHVEPYMKRKPLAG